MSSSRPDTRAVKIEARSPAPGGARPPVADDELQRFVATGRKALPTLETLEAVRSRVLSARSAAG
jgi:hypothetical protein